MWMIFAFAAAFFAGLTSVLAKCGIKKTDSTVATAVRTVIVLLFAWVMVFIVGSQGTITQIETKTLVFLYCRGLPREHHGSAILRLYSLATSIRSCR